MKKIYIQPEVNAIALITSDVITLSGQKKAELDSEMKYNYYEIGESFWDN